MNRAVNPGFLWCLAVLQTCLALPGKGGEPPAGLPPRFSPDYAGLVIPPNIAPLNFRILDPGRSFRVRLEGRPGGSIDLTSRTPIIRWPMKQWRSVLELNRGRELRLRVSSLNADGAWVEYAPVTNAVAQDPIESHVVYRLLGPLFNLYYDLGVYQRSLETFQESLVVANTSFNRGCVNCHTFLENRPDTFTLHIREQRSGNPMMLVISNQIARVSQTAGYVTWHPSGRLLAFSSNKLGLWYHSRGETREVFDAESNLHVYRVDSNVVTTPPAIARPDFLETWPSWSPDGRFLYYCRAPRVGVDQFYQVRYDLMRVSYDIERDEWGDPETLVSGDAAGMSAAQPRVSPDGARVLFCSAQYGNFPIYQRNCDLYVYELEAKRPRRLEINSQQADSWHSWSRNGRWVVFSSKRRDGLFTRPYITYVDAQGVFHKPFVVPQEDPDFYDYFLKNYNLPELVAGPVLVGEGLGRAVLNPTRTLHPAGEIQAPKRGTREAPVGAQ